MRNSIELQLKKKKQEKQQQKQTFPNRKYTELLTEMKTQCFKWKMITPVSNQIEQ